MNNIFGGYTGNMKWVNAKDQLPYKNTETVSCLVKLSDNNVRILDYYPESSKWYLPNSDILFNDSEVSYWAFIKDVDDELSGKPDKEWCFDYNKKLADISVNAFSHWLENGMSYPYNLTYKKWCTILKKIQDTFIETQNEINGKYDNLSVDERIAKSESNKKARRTAFRLMADYYMDLWD